MNPKMKVLVCDPVHEVGIEKLEQAGFEVHVKPSISGEELRNVACMHLVTFEDSNDV